MSNEPEQEKPEGEVTEETKPEEQSTQTPNEPESPKKKLSFRALAGFEEPEKGAPDLPEKEEEPEKKPESSEKADSVSEKPEEEKPKEESEKDSDTLEFKGTEVKAKKKEPKSPPVKESPLSKEDVEEIFKKTQQEKEKEKTKPDDSDLPEHIRDELATWEYGEKEGLADKGTAEKIRSHFRERKALIERLERENAGDEDYDVTKDRAYKRFVTEKSPKLSETLKKKIERKQIRDEILSEVKKGGKSEDDKRVAALENQLKEMREKPQIEASVNEYDSTLRESLKTDETAKAIVEKWGDDAYAKGFEPKIQAKADQSKRVAEEFMLIRRGLKDYDPQDKHHQFLGKFIDHESRKIMADPKLANRGGKQFIHPYENDGTKDGWTLSNEDILKMLQRATRQSIAKAIREEDERLEGIFKSRQGTPSQKEEAKGGEEDKGGDTTTKPRPSGNPEKQGGKPKGKFSKMFGA